MTSEPFSSDLPIIRDNDWLADRLAEVWYRYFPDVDQVNEVSIAFGRQSRTRLGSIGMPKPKGPSTITITGYFKNERVPDYVVDATIGHELVHYAHGFHSPHPQLYRYPHQGRIVDKEMRRRGMGDMLKQQRRWLKQHWSAVTRSRRRYGRMSLLQFN